MSGRMAGDTRGALARARERRRALDRARDAHDQRVEERTAAALVALAGRAELERALAAATGRLAAALRDLLAEQVSVQRAAALLELDAADVRRLTRTTTGEQAGGQP